MGDNIEDNSIRFIGMLVPYQWDGEENCCDVGGWGGQILWEADVLEDLYGEKNESDLTKTQNS